MFILPPRTSWLYRFGISLSSTHRYLLTLLFIIGCSTVWFFYIYMPMQTRIENVQQLSKNPHVRSEKELKDGIATFHQEFAQKPTAPSGDDKLHVVLGYVDQAGLSLEHCAVQEKAIALQASGTFKQIQGLFDQLSASGQRLNPRDVRISRSVDNHFTLWAVVEVE